MQIAAVHFKRRAAAAVADEFLQDALNSSRGKFVDGRARAFSALADSPAHNFESLSEEAKNIRDRAIARLDFYLEEFERRAVAAGSQVLWASDAASACRHIVEIAKRHKVRRAVKSKTMVSEEIALNDSLLAAGIEVTETDLGEYILQLAGDSPTHIIAPAIHIRLAEVSRLFSQAHGGESKSGIAELCKEARTQLRPKFLNAEMGITGANFLISESGTAMMVTNEGNGRFSATLPKVHITVAAIDKIIPTWKDAAVMLRLLPRSATGQEITNYVTFATGIKKDKDPDGPSHHYIVLVDGGRSQLLGGPYQEMLRCIRCGACMNHCPVYQTVGGGAYGWVYPGPMGAVLTPALAGLHRAPDLPHATTVCGACESVCPVKIPLTRMMRDLREEEVIGGIRPLTERILVYLWAASARWSFIYDLWTRIAARILSRLGKAHGRIVKLPLANGWFCGRDLESPPGRTFRELYKKGGGGV